MHPGSFGSLGLEETRAHAPDKVPTFRCHGLEVLVTWCRLVLAPRPTQKMRGWGCWSADSRFETRNMV